MFKLKNEPEFIQKINTINKDTEEFKKPNPLKIKIKKIDYPELYQTFCCIGEY